MDHQRNDAIPGHRPPPPFHPSVLAHYARELAKLAAERAASEQAQQGRAGR